ncbi:MAG: HTTM domain-containing protein [Planctomycetaceae bacterium]|nr:HTTM domain-containing protein [Planctomycetaceae bacterium]
MGVYSRFLQHSAAHLTRPVDGAFLAFFRFAVGAAFLFSCLSYLTTGWVEYFYVSPAFHFKYFGFEWVRVLPGNGMRWLFQALWVCAVLVATGTCYWISSLLLAVGYTYVFLIDKSQYQNHYYLLMLTAWLLVFVPAQRVFSVDRWWASRRVGQKKGQGVTVPGWCLWLVRFQVALPYFFGGIAKLNSDWIYGQPMRMKLSNSTWYPVIGTFFTEEWCVQMFVWGGLLFDLLVVPLLLWKRTRLAAFFVSLSFHLMNATLFSIGVFPWFMILATTVFFEPDWPRLFRRRVLRGRPRSAAGADVSRDTPRWLVVGLIGYVAVQLLLPWRHLFYPGNVSWTEEGHFFAWHMKLRDKKTVCKFRWRDPQTDEIGDINILQFITQQQASHATGDPEMIVQFCRFLKQQISRQRGRECEIYALNLTSLNGRRPQPLVNPTMDLGSVPHGVSLPDSVCMALSEPLRPYNPWRVPREEWVHHIEVENHEFWFGVKAAGRDRSTWQVPRLVSPEREAQSGRQHSGTKMRASRRLLASGGVR